MYSNWSILELFVATFFGYLPVDAFMMQATGLRMQMTFSRLAGSARMEACHPG
jgi:hypothetical protein